MAILQRAFTGSICLTAAILLAACGGSGSPTAPSSRSRSSGATIAGRVSGATGAVALNGSASVAAAATSSVTVKVTGTNITSVVDGSGRFVLTEVPSGSVRLEFSGPGTNATVTISGVAEGDRIDIVVTLNGTIARLQSQTMDTEGAVSGLTGACPTLTFSVRGRLVHTSAATSFKDGSCAAIQNNTMVEAKGPMLADGSIQATTVELDEESDDDEGELELTGKVSGLTGNCPMIVFTLGGTTIEADNTTRFDGRCSAVQNGRAVEVTGVQLPNGRVRAAKIKVED